MHPLLMLYKLQGKALFRRMKRSMGSVKGAFLFLFGIAAVGLWIAPSAWQAMRMPRTDPAKVLEIAPVIMLAMCLFSLVASGGEKAVAFTPAEVDFLFPGPFTRRQLLAYKVGKSFIGLLFSSLLMSVVFLKYATSWPQAWVGLFLALLFMQLFSMAITLIAQSAGERAYTLTRKIILGIVIVGIAAMILPALKEGGRPGFFAVAQMLQSSPVGSVLLAPLKVFAKLFVAGGWWPGGLAYAAAAAAIDGAVLLIVFYLDADYLESAAAKSQAVYARMQRIRRGGLSAMSRPAKKGKLVIPRLPFLGGAGPIVWRQTTTAMRNSRGLLFILIIVALAVGPILTKATRSQNSAEHSNVATPLMGSGKHVAADDPITTPVVLAITWMTLIVGAWLRFDFRGDLDLIDHLKSLPISAAAVSVGQLITPTLMMTACHLVIVGSVAVAAHRMEPVVLAVVVLSLPFNLLMFGVENFMFLLFPTRAAANPADFQGWGRQILMIFAKGGIVLVAGALAGIAALIVNTLTHSRAGALAAAAVVLTGLAIGAVPIVGWAFKRFDVAGDVPA
jgi:hypothetical protein